MDLRGIAWISVIDAQLFYYLVTKLYGCKGLAANCNTSSTKICHIGLVTSIIQNTLKWDK